MPTSYASGGSSVVADTQMARIEARCLPHISGRVLAQALPSVCHDVDGTVRVARLYDAAWQAAGIPR